MTERIAPTPPDPHLWLEDIEGDGALAWVDEQNRRTLDEFYGDEAQATADAIRAALDSEDRIPGVSKLGDHYYNFCGTVSIPRACGAAPRGIPT